jgi:hypothetical protein
LPGRAPRVERVDTGTVVFDATIDPQSASTLIDILHNSRLHITKLVLNSAGGFAPDSERIFEAVKHLAGLRIWVPAHATCQSACIRILAASPDTVDVDPTATLMFHAAVDRVSLSDCKICVLNNRLIVWASMRLPWHDHRAMLPWATTLSAKLPELFSMCSIHPLDTPQGITVTGAEFAGLRNGGILPGALTQHCPTNKT